MKLSIRHHLTPAISERRLWAAALLAILNEYRQEYRFAMKYPDRTCPDRVIGNLRSYLASRDGRTVCALAGLEDIRTDLIIQQITSAPSKALGHVTGETKPPKRRRKNKPQTGATE